MKTDERAQYVAQIIAERLAEYFEKVRSDVLAVPDTDVMEEIILKSINPAYSSLSDWEKTSEMGPAYVRAAWLTDINRAHFYEKALIKIKSGLSDDREYRETARAALAYPKQTE